METTKHGHSGKSEQLIHIFTAVATFFSLTALVLYTNMRPDTWLIGWDNLLPELNFPLNVGRSLTAVWQEYQSTGLLGGMGHASALPRELALWAASLIFPIHTLRYLWTGAMIFTGMLGVYLLVKKVLATSQEHPDSHMIHLISITSGIYYLTNLATVQIFRAPFEAFITHHAALPWILWGVYSVLHKPSKKFYITLASLSFALSTQSYIPTLFLVSIIHITILCLFILLTSSHKIHMFKTICIAYLIIISSNAYWLIPSAYFTLTKSSVTVNAKINQMATEEVYLRNKKFGTFTDALTLRNFWFDNVEYDPKAGSISPMMQEWTQQYSASIPYLALVIIAYTIMFGFIVSLTHKKTIAWGILGFISFAMLANDVEPFASSMNWLRIHIPLFSQFFRFPFTKWGSSVALLYSLLLGISIYFVSKKLSKSLRIPLIVTSISLLLFSVYPAFTGHLFSSRFTISIPDDYIKLFQYMNTKPDGRIAVLPQQTYWDWKYYDWGDLGSGFLWYGIKQPILDRAFDVWSSSSENYYWEFSRALYSKNSLQMNDTLRKYDVRYVLVDEHIVSASHDRALAINEINEFFSNSQDFTLAQTFGKIRLYEYKNPQSTSFVYTAKELPRVSPVYKWTDNDTALNDIGQYISGENYSGADAKYTFPFRSLFTKRSVQERDFLTHETDTDITIKSIDESTSAGILKDSALVYDSTTTRDLSASNVTQCELFKNGNTQAENLSEPEGYFLRFSNTNQRGCLSFGIPTLPHRDGYLVAVTARHIQGRPLLFSMINMTARHSELETFLSSDLTWKTTYFILPPLASDGLGYNPYISNDSIGRQMSVNDIASIKIYIIPYDAMTHVSSINGTPMPTTFAPASRVYHPNPAYYKITLKPDGSPTRLDSANRVGAGMTNTLILSQSFDDGWIALTPSKTFPYAQPVGKHVLVNNWENGWSELPENTSTVYLFFWPQLLEWLGLLLLPVLFIYAAGTKNHQHEL